MAPSHEPLDRRIADIVCAGRVRVAMLPPQYTKGPDGKLRGWAIDVAAALSARLGIALLPLECAGPRDVLSTLEAGTCDVGVLPNHPSWAHRVDFSSAFLQFDFTFLTPAASAICSVADVDEPGTRIAVVSHHASTLTLLPLLKYAKPIIAETLNDAFELLRDGHADVFASTRPQLVDDCLRLPGSRVLDDRYGFNSMALAVSKGHAQRLAYLDEFIQDVKAVGLLQQAIERAGWRGVHVF